MKKCFLWPTSKIGVEIIKRPIEREFCFLCPETETVYWTRRKLARKYQDSMMLIELSQQWTEISIKDMRRTEGASNKCIFSNFRDSFVDPWELETSTRLDEKQAKAAVKVVSEISLNLFQD